MVGANGYLSDVHISGYSGNSSLLLLARRSLTAVWRVEVLFTGIVAVYLLSLAVNSVTNKGAFSPDSTVYINMAQNLSEGKGLSFSVGQLNRGMEGIGKLPTPVTIYAPAYPILITLLTKSGLSMEMASLTIPVVFLGLLLLSAFWMMSLVTPGYRATGFAVVAGLIHFAPLRMATMYAWSETMGLTFMIVALALLLVPRSTRRLELLIPVLAGLVIGLAYASRYALLPLVVVAPLFLIESSCWKTVRNWVLCGGASLLIGGPIVVRNLIVSGSIRGGTSVSQVTLQQAVSDLFDTLVSLSGPPMVLILLLLTIALAITREIKKKEWRLIKRQGLLLVWTLIYTVFLVYAATQTRIDPIDFRLTLPATVVLVVLVGAFVAKALPYRAVIILALALVLVPAWNQWSEASNLVKITGGRDMHSRSLGNGVLPWLADNVDQDDLVIIEGYSDLPFLLGRPVLTLYFNEGDIGQASDLASYLTINDNNKSETYLVIGSSTSLPNQFLLQLALVGEFSDGKIFRLVADQVILAQEVE